ncbi:MAG: hypothetical protein ACQEXB_18460 [Bacillota bacterium]
MAKLIEIKKGEQVLHVTEKAFRVVYEGYGYHKIGEVEGQSGETTNEDEVDLFTLTETELKKVNKDEVQAFLDKEGIEYESNAKKEELIALIVGD